MDWCRLDTAYYLDRAVLRAGEAAEVLFLRCIAYSGAEESRGVIPRYALPMLAPTKTNARLEALLREGLLIDEGEDVRIRSWERWQESLDIEAERRRKDRERKAAVRAKVRAKSSDKSADVSADSSQTVQAISPRIEVEVEEDSSPSEKSTPSPQTARTPRVVGDFDEFWTAYPRKTAKDAARRAYAKALKRADRGAILAGAMRYAADASRDPAFTAYPATWLNDGRWDDEGPVRPVGRQVGSGIASATDDEYLAERFGDSA